MTDFIVPSSPRVEVVILNWKRVDDTLRCIEAVGAGDYDNVRVTVVDNGSDDGSADILRQHTAIDRFIESDTNLGFAGGCNLALRDLDDDVAYVWLLNNDAVARADALSQLVAVGEKYSRVGLVGSVTHWMDEPGRVQGWGGGTVSLWTGVSRHVLGPDSRPDYLTGASLLIRRALLDQVGGLDETFFFYWEDVDLSFKARIGGWSLAVAGKSVVTHAESASLGTHSEAQARHSFTGLAIFLRRYARFPLVAIGLRMMHHSAVSIYRGRWDSLIGAWRGILQGIRA